MQEPCLRLSRDPRPKAARSIVNPPSLVALSVQERSICVVETAPAASAVGAAGGARGVVALAAVEAAERFPLASMAITWYQ